MEYAEGGDLSTYISKKKHLSEDEARKIFQQIIDGIFYLHQIGICHRNLKLENILFSSNKRDTIKIINFGKSNLYLTGVNSNNPTLSFGAEFLETPFGILEYTPPEVILGLKYDGLLLDIWFCGIILYVMLFGIFPFEDKNEDKLYTKIIKGEFTFPKNVHISEEAKLLIKKILVVNPRLRSNFNDIRRDTWFMKDYEQIPGLYISIRNIPISERIIGEMVKFGFKKNEIIKNIKNNKHNKITTFYYLLVNKLRSEGISDISDLISKEFKEYLREQDLKNNLIKKGEKPISLKIMKSNSKELFIKNDLSKNEQNKEFDLDYFKSIFQDYNSVEKIRPMIKKNINNLKKDKKKNIIKNNQKSSTKNKRAKSQNNKKINKKNNIIIKDRNSYSSSIRKMNHKKNNLNKTKEKEEIKSNSKIKQIINIKEIIPEKNRNISNIGLKNSTIITSSLNPTRNHLVFNSNSFSKNKKNSIIINKNIFNNIINDSVKKMDKIKKLKEKNIKNNNIKNLSLKNIYYKEYIYKNTTSRNKLSLEINNESKTTRTFIQKKNKSSSTSKSKSLKSKSNYSTEKGKKIFSEKHSQGKKRDKHLNSNTNEIKITLFGKNLSNKKSIKRKDIEKKSKSTSSSKIKKRTNNKEKYEYYINNSKSKSKNNKNDRGNSKLKNQRKSKERTLPSLSSSTKIKNNSKEKNKFRNSSISKNKHKKKDKIVEINLEKFIPNKKGTSQVENELDIKKSHQFNLYSEEISFNKKINKSKEKIKNLNTYHKERKNSNKITNIKRARLPNENDKKNESHKKNKIKEIKSIKISNIPKNDRVLKTENNLKNLLIKEEKKDKFNHKNRMVINFKKFNNG